MKLSIASALLLATTASAAFYTAPTTTTTSTRLFGYLDDLSKDLYAKADNPDIQGDSKEATDLDKEKVDRFGVGEWDSYVEFDEFDGGDGQMGVAGDGNTKLEKFGSDVSPQLAKSKVMSAKNAWGRTTGYAQDLIDKGMEEVRAQQMENWLNQQEVLKQRQEQRYMTEEFDQVSGDEDWRSLSKFGVERNQQFDLEETFGGVEVGGDMEGVIELTARIGQTQIYEFSLKNQFMGFADFRAALSGDTNTFDWTVTPTEGSLSSKEGTPFVVKFRPNNPGFSEGYLVIETEDFKKTWKLVGSTA